MAEWLDADTAPAGAERSARNPRKVYDKRLAAGQVTLDGNRASPAAGPANDSNHVVLVD